MGLGGSHLICTATGAGARSEGLGCCRFSFDQMGLYKAQYQPSRKSPVATTRPARNPSPKPPPGVAAAPGSRPRHSRRLPGFLFFFSRFLFFLERLLISCFSHGVFFPASPPFGPIPSRLARRLLLDRRHSARTAAILVLLPAPARSPWFWCLNPRRRLDHSRSVGFLLACSVVSGLIMESIVHATPFLLVIPCFLPGRRDG